MSDTQFVPLPLPAELCSKIMYSGHIRHPLSDIIKRHWAKQWEIYFWIDYKTVYTEPLENGEEFTLSDLEGYEELVTYQDYFEEGYDGIDKWEEDAKRIYNRTNTSPWLLHDIDFPKYNPSLESIEDYIMYDITNHWQY